MDSWRVTGLDEDEVIATFNRILAVRAPIYVAPDPDVAAAQFDASDAEIRGEPVDVAEYPAGTWFYYGQDVVAVRLPGAKSIARLEMRT